jgi:hypothetical protein
VGTYGVLRRIMTRARDVANFLTGTATFTGTVTVPTPVNPTDAANKAYVDTASGSDIGLIDNIYFDGTESRYLPKSNGEKITITNPYKVEVSVNGALQTVSENDNVWLSPIPRQGLIVDSDGYLSFTEVPPAGSTFAGKIILGPTTNTSAKTYPFSPIDIVLGA